MCCRIYTDLRESSQQNQKKHLSTFIHLDCFGISLEDTVEDGFLKKNGSRLCLVVPKKNSE